MRARHLAVVLAPVGLLAALAWAQSAPRNRQQSGVISGPQTVTGPVNMVQNLWVDGGVSTTTLRADRADIGTLDAGTVRADSITAGSVDAGTLYAQSARFGTRPLGVFLPGLYARGTGLPLSTLGGWVSILPTGVFLTVDGALPRDGCELTEVPAGLNLLNVDYRCDVVAPNQVDIQFKALIGLTIPAGTYAVLISGPGQ